MKNKILLFGIGYWGQKHLRVLSNINEISEIYVFDPSIERINEVKNLYLNVNFINDYKKIIDKNIINGAIIATPPQTHYNLGKECLENNIHVLIEKPIVEKLNQLETLNQIATKNNLVLMSGHTFIYNNGILKIKEIIDSGELGDICYCISDRLNFGIVRDDISLENNLAPHDLSIMQFLFDNNNIKDIKKNGISFLSKNSYDYQTIRINYSNNIKCIINLSWYYPEKVRKIYIIGTKKMLVFDDLLQKKIKVYSNTVDSRDLSNIIQEGYYEPEISMEEPLMQEQKHFLDSFKNPRSCKTGYEHNYNIIKILNEK